jgi:hypothetical protein
VLNYCSVAPDVTCGDLVRVDAILSLIVCFPLDAALRSDTYNSPIGPAIFIEKQWIDLGVDKELCPVILYNGRRVAVTRGIVVRADKQ